MQSDINCTIFYLFTVHDQMRNVSVDTSQKIYHRVKILTVSSLSFAICLISCLAVICILRLIHFSLFPSFSLHALHIKKVLKNIFTNINFIWIVIEKERRLQKLRFKSSIFIGYNKGKAILYFKKRNNLIQLIIVSQKLE